MGPSRAENKFEANCRTQARSTEVAHRSHQTSPTSYRQVGGGASSMDALATEVLRKSQSMTELFHDNEAAQNAGLEVVARLERVNGLLSLRFCTGFPACSRGSPDKLAKRSKNMAKRSKKTFITLNWAPRSIPIRKTIIIKWATKPKARRQTTTINWAPRKAKTKMRKT